MNDLTLYLTEQRRYARQARAYRIRSDNAATEDRRLEYRGLAAHYAYKAMACHGMIQLELSAIQAGENHG